MRLSTARITITPIAALIVAAAVVAVIDVPGCSLFRPKFTTPQLSIVNIEIERSNLFTQHLDVRMRVENPNDRELPVQGLSYELFVAGEEAARGVSTASFTVPPLGEAEFDMEVTANLAGALLQLLSQTGSRSGIVPYRIVGKVELSRGLLRSIPFEERGAVTLK
ncbi:MAG: LEA type 2 family protein [Steroidobacteraceae bacterium]